MQIAALTKFMLLGIVPWNPIFLFFLNLYSRLRNFCVKTLLCLLYIYIYIYLLLFFSPYFFINLLFFHILSWKKWLFSLSLSLSIFYSFLPLCFRLMNHCVFNNSILSNMFWCCVFEFPITTSISTSYSFNLIFVWVNT